MTALIQQVVSSSHLDFEPACTGQTHARGLGGHVPEQPASFLVVLGCGHDYLMCRGWVEDDASFDAIVCGACWNVTQVAQVVSLGGPHA